MSQFLDFVKHHGNGSKCEDATKAIIEQYLAVLPAELIAFWSETGWCAFSKGLFWVVNPADFVGVADEWFETKDSLIVIGRSAFGNLLIWDGSKALFLDVLYGKYIQLSEFIDDFFDMSLSDKSFLENVLNQSVFEQALQKLGELERDEVYAFEPALALGGEMIVDNLNKVKLKEHLSILAQLSSPASRI